MEFFFSQNIHNNIITLDPIESKHCVKVMRNNIGDCINVVDGKGNLYEGEILSINKLSSQIKIKNITKNYCKKDYYIHIGISPIKNHDRLEWFVEKSIEIGIDEISLINCTRTLREKVKLNRLYKTAISAIKQTLKAKLPIINEPMNIKDFIQGCNNNNNFICHLEKDKRQNLFSFKGDILKYSNSCVLIGPEGDFTLDEINLCKNNGFNSITLGDSRLRTETAGIVVCNLLNIIQS